MDTPPIIHFDLLTGIRENSSYQVGIVQVEMDLTKLDSEPLYTQDAVNPYEAIDTCASPLLFKGVPAILSESSEDLQMVLFPLYPTPNGRNKETYSAARASVDSYGGCLDLLDVEGHTIQSDVDLESAHAVTWDPASRHIFAVGARELRLYSNLGAEDQAALVPVGIVDFSLLYEGRDMDKRDSSTEGGHDLYFMAGERRLFMTTGERCFSVDIDRLLQDLAKEPDIPYQIKILSWQQTGDCGIDRFESFFKIKSKMSDDYFDGGTHNASYPRDKIGGKAINRIPGTLVTFVHAYPHYPPDSGYLSNILLLSRGEYDRPSLYDPQPDDPSTNLRMVLKNATYRCRVIPQLPTGQKMGVLPVLESARIQFCSWTGGLGKVGSPHLRVTGIDQQISDLFSTLIVPSVMDQDNFVYGYVVIEQDGCQREAIIRIQQGTETSGDCDGMLVGANPKYLVAIYAWATPFVLDWSAKKAFDGNGLTITVETIQPVDQKLESISAWIRTSPLLPGMMVQLSKVDLERGSFSEAISGPRPFYSIMLFAKSMEGFLYCRGEQLLEAKDNFDGVEP
ncbi:hypothetical protein EC968_002031 [Mortierella alpina]|nr:hypothetical protein EC968_002031 [Mortierella alpina]